MRTTAQVSEIQWYPSSMTTLKTVLQLYFGTLQLSPIDACSAVKDTVVSLLNDHPKNCLTIVFWNLAAVIHRCLLCCQGYSGIPPQMTTLKTVLPLYFENLQLSPIDACSAVKDTVVSLLNDRQSSLKCRAVLCQGMLFGNTLQIHNRVC